MNTKGIDIFYDLIIVSLLLLSLANNWFLLLFLFAGLVAHAVRSIRRKKRKKAKTQNKALAVQKKTASAYGVITADITFALMQKYPDATWLWENPAEARDLVMNGFATEIMIWHAPVNRAVVEINLQTKRLKRMTFHANRFNDMVFENQPDETFRVNEAYDAMAEEEIHTTKKRVGVVDYSLYAFQWVDSNLPLVSQRVRDAADEELHNLQLLPDQLPKEKQSWADVVEELERKHFDAELLPDDAGIMLNF